MTDSAAHDAVVAVIGGGIVGLATAYALTQRGLAPVVIEKEPTRDHSERMLRGFGAEIRVEDTPEGRVITLTGRPELKPQVIAILLDASRSLALVVRRAVDAAVVVGVLLAPLGPIEIELLPDLMVARLCTSITVQMWRAKMYPEDAEYLLIHNAQVRARLKHTMKFSRNELIDRVSNQLGSAS